MMKTRWNHCQRNAARSRGCRRRFATGAVLMEVVLALILFVGAAAILTGGMNVSIKTLDRMRLNMHASNLASSLMAETQMGLRPAVTTGEEPFDAPFEEWTWEMVATDLGGEYDVVSASDSGGLDGAASETGELRLIKLEVIIRHGFESITHRLVQVVPVVPTVEPDVVDEATVGEGDEELLP